MHVFKAHSAAFRASSGSESHESIAAFLRRDGPSCDYRDVDSLHSRKWAKRVETDDILGI